MKLIKAISAYLLLSGCLFQMPAYGENKVRIAVLDFELKDLTLKPNTPEELERTSLVGPILRWALEQNTGFELIEIDAADQAEANTAFGYLFSHGPEAARLGEKYNADYVIVGQLLKPSYLIQFLDIFIASVKEKQFVGRNLRQTVYGGSDQNKILKKGAGKLAEEITCVVEIIPSSSCKK